MGIALWIFFWKQGNEDAKIYFLTEIIVLSYFPASSGKLHMVLQSLWCR